VSGTRRALRSIAAVALMVCAGAWLLLLAGAWLLDGAAPERVPGAGGERVATLARDDAEPWRMLVLSDLQNGVVYLGEILERARDAQPLAVLLLGDIARDHDDAHLARAAREFQRHPALAPLFAVPGNHDISGDEGRASFVRYFGGAEFDLTVGNTRFLGVDNADGALGAEPLAALSARLDDATARGQRIVIVAHRGMVNGLSSPSGKRKHDLEEEHRGVLELVERHDVRLVLGGHHHFPMDEKRYGARFVIVPASGDSSYDTGQTPVSFTWLVWDGAEFLLEHEEFYRRNHAQLAGAFAHLTLAHVRPALAAVAVLAPLSLLVALVALVAGVRLLRGARA